MFVTHCINTRHTLYLQNKRMCGYACNIMYKRHKSVCKLSVNSVEGLYCKRPIQSLASSEILTPPPPHPLARGGEDTLARWRGGGGVTSRKTPDTALYSICKYFVVNSFPVRNTCPGEGGPRHSTLKQISYVPHS